MQNKGKLNEGFANKVVNANMKLISNKFGGQFTVIWGSLTKNV